MGKRIKCWEFWQCDEKECPVYKCKELKLSKEVNCWLVSGTHCREGIRGRFLEKMEACTACKVFKVNIDTDSMQETMRVLNEQFIAFREMVEERDRELEDISMEMALGLSEVFEALNKISSGNPSVRISEISKLELIAKLKNIVNKTAQNIGEIVDLSHDFAIGLAEHFDVLNRVSKGNLAARVHGTSEVELLELLKNVTNQMIESVSREITEREHGCR
jgi:hypothetical protein